MKTNILIGTFVLAASLAMAQAEKAPAEKKSATVRIKKIENINGVEKITDTTFTTDDLSSIKPVEGCTIIKHSALKDEGGKPENRRVVMLTDQSEDVQVHTDEKTGTKTITIIKKDGVKEGGPVTERIVLTDPEGKHSRVMVMTGDEKMTPEMEKAFEEANKYLKAHEGEIKSEGLIVVDQENAATDGDKGKTVKKMIIIRTVKISDITTDDETILNKTTGVGDKKLSSDEMKFYPNPSDGKFNLTFSLASKGDAEINVINIEGRSIYNEKLPSFSGKYDKQIDISQNPKGTYFVKIAQGDHTLVKKVVLE